MFQDTGIFFFHFLTIQKIHFLVGEKRLKSIYIIKKKRRFQDVIQIPVEVFLGQFLESPCDASLGGTQVLTGVYSSLFLDIFHAEL